MNTCVIIPALNEAGAIAGLVQDVVARKLGSIIVVDNGSTDGTATAAAGAGATVVSEPRRGYGYASAAGAAAAQGIGADVLVFMDGDGSFAPAEIPCLVAPLREARADLVLGSRVLGNIEPGSMPPAQRFGNWLVAQLMRRTYRVELTDMGPFRAVRADLIWSLGMQEMTFGWPVEMVVKAARRKARIVEVPVTYSRRQSGQSKVSGTVRGTILAGYRMLAVVIRSAR
jgi:glycosyltransferase involved in cell wall biosynthesis